MEKLEIIMLALESNEYETFKTLANMLSKKEKFQLARKIFATQNSFYIYYFALNVQRESLAELAKTVVETKNAKLIYKLAHIFKDVPIRKLDTIQDYQDALDNGDNLLIDTMIYKPKNAKETLEWLSDKIKSGKLDEVKNYLDSLDNKGLKLKRFQKKKDKK